MEKNVHGESMSGRLSRLEEELDHLIHLQEHIKTSRANVDYEAIPRETGSTRWQRARCLSATRAVPHERSVLPQCVVGASAPLADITKFLQHIHLNLFKGTQAITKIAKSTSQSGIDNGPNNINYHENCIKKTETSKDTNLMNSFGKKVEEDALYKELREEKDKRQRAENQVKKIKEELKMSKTENQRSADYRTQQLQEELRDVLKQLNSTKLELEKRNQECQQAEYVWPYRYETVCKELQEELVKRNEAEKNVQKLREMLQKMYVNSEELCSLQKTSSWLKDQNESLICLSKKLRSEVEDKMAEVARKNETIEENWRKIKQLTGLCEKLRDFVIAVRRRTADNEQRLKENQTRSQKLTEKLLEAQTTQDNLRAAQERDRSEHSRLTGLIAALNAANDALHTRVEEMSGIMKDQNRLIARQSDTISAKEDQLTVVSEHNKLLSQKLLDLEKKSVSPAPHSFTSWKALEDEVDRVKLELENKSEMLLIKEKIIESHLQSVSQLKNTLDRKEEEIKHKRKEITEIERKLEIEKTRSYQLESRVKTLLSQKEELIKTVEELEEELESRMSSEEASRLEQIEKQIKQKQKEWEEGKSVLTKEKESALAALRSASQKLADRTVEHQAETAALHRLSEKLTVELREKDAKLLEATEKISKLTTDLNEAGEKAEMTRRSFEQKLQSACEAWKTTMALLQTDN